MSIIFIHWLKLPTPQKLKWDIVVATLNIWIPGGCSILQSEDELCSSRSKKFTRHRICWFRTCLCLSAMRLCLRCIAVPPQGAKQKYVHIKYGYVQQYQKEWDPYFLRTFFGHGASTSTYQTFLNKLAQSKSLPWKIYFLCKTFLFGFPESSTN